MTESIIIRRATADDYSGIAEVHVSSWKTTYKGLISDKILDSLSVESRSKGWKNILNTLQEDSAVVYVAENLNGKIVGFAHGGKNRTPQYNLDAELYSIYLLENYQKLGIGRRLVTQIASELYNFGNKSMLVWVLTGNSSKIAYEKLGAKEFVTKEFNLGDEVYLETGMAWEDLTKLINY